MGTSGGGRENLTVTEGLLEAQCGPWGPQDCEIFFQSSTRSPQLLSQESPSCFSHSETCQNILSSSPGLPSGETSSPEPDLLGIYQNPD